MRILTTICLTVWVAGSHAWAADAPPAKHEPAQLTIPGPATDNQSSDGGLNKNEIITVIRAGLPAIRGCYEKRLKVKKKLAGKMTASWIISPEGDVDTVEIVNSTVPDSRLEGCVAETVRKWVFPKPRGGAPVAVNYPFVFDPGKN